MTSYQCGSCSYESDDLDEAQEHSFQTGHVCIGKDGAGSAGGRFGKARGAAGVGISVLAASALGVFAWKYKALAAEKDDLAAENSELKSTVDRLAAENSKLTSMAGQLVVQLAELITENDYLKSRTGAGKNLRRFRE
ncbi:MAG: hypothetical protein JF597_47025 [Streptomyces sp.]|jgi:hypothetical protein|uniref:hypothetical protein n=1 Tax=Streptomyces sp. TaxID=1931 RepID=UPI0025DD55A1|nr:hypothetical protein [Streptomyces sp.]MBW8800847.1 hypothetical protein [Streptomyces sp.]